MRITQLSDNGFQRLPFTLLGSIRDPFGSIKIGTEVNPMLSRRDCRVSWNQTTDTGSIMVGSEVKVEITFEAVKK